MCRRSSDNLKKFYSDFLGSNTWVKRVYSKRKCGVMKVGLSA